MIQHKYLTNKGYIVNKKYINSITLERIKTELTVKPNIHPDYDINIESFELFTEKEDYIIVPRYYGINNFGSPIKEIFPKEKKIKIKFIGTLRENQIDITQKCFNYLKNKKGGIIVLPCGFGKCLCFNTPVMLYDGTIKNVQDIQIGDQLMGDDSTPRNVLSLAQGKEKAYDIISSDGNKYTVNKSHIISLKCITKYDRKLIKIIDISVENLLKLQKKCFNNKNVYLMGYRVPIHFEKKPVSIDPYLLGHLLCDGSINGIIAIYKHQIIINYLKKKMQIIGLSLKRKIIIDKYKRKLYYRIIHNSCTKINNASSIILNNILNNKYIPHQYKCNSRQIRLELLAGIIDSDGYLDDNNYYNICLKNEQLIDDIIFIARSVGLAAYKSMDKFYKVHILGDTNIIPVKLERKRAKQKTQIIDPLVYRIKLKYVGIKDYYGFQLDGNGRFLLGDFTVTHNTTIALYLISQLKLKTLIVVHKTFLQNQWYDRIEQFTNAKIGIIRQNKIDIENKDIVIGMLQSIAMKDYDNNIFNDFGIVVFDECFPYDEKVITNKGVIKIGKLYQLWKNNNQLPLVLSYNINSKQFEYKKILYAWKKTTNTLICVNFESQIITCTPNHKFLTINGYKEACFLEKEDILLKYNGDDLELTNIVSISKVNINKYNRDVFDIEVEDNHNFIIAPNQNYTNKNYNGIIVHNCHRVPSRIFSKALQKIGTRYILGLTATPNRSDGLTKVLYWYIGDIIYKLERPKNNRIVVKVFNYESNDKFFVEKKQWIKGKIKIGIQKMITNMYKIEPRNQFIIDVLYNLVQQENRKIILLSGRIEHLKKLKSALDNLIKENIKRGLLEKNEYKTSFYIGKMSELELSIAAEADIIFGTYAMAKEGLDIEGLNTLVLATPNVSTNDLIQSIGRIMRKPLEEYEVNPMIIDIIDQFSCFPTWGDRRLNYYYKQNYKINKYIVWNDKCITVKDYLKLKNIIPNESEEDYKENNKIDVRKKYICYKYGEDYYELEKEAGFDEDDNYEYDPDLSKILNVPQKNEFD